MGHIAKLSRAPRSRRIRNKKGNDENDQTPRFIAAPEAVPRFRISAETVDSSRPK
jgi:hypothetical protein